MPRWLRVVGVAAWIGSAVWITLSAQQPSPASPSRTGAISGVVTDGVDGPSVAGAQVVLTFIRPGAAAPIRRTQLTDSLGRFVFTDLEAGDSYRLSASGTGFADGAYGQAIAVANSSAALSLASGQWLANLKIALWRHASLSGQVSNERGEPLAGVFVRALMRVRAAGLHHLAAGPIVTTDDRGRYRMAGLRPGTYFVYVPIVAVSVPSTISVAALRPGPLLRMTVARAAEFSGSAAAAPPLPTVGLTETTLSVLTDYPLPPRAAGGRLLAYPLTFAGGATSFDHAQPIEVGAGADRDGHDVRLLPVPASLVPGVVDAPERGAPTRSIRLLAPGLEELGPGSEAAIALPDVDGTFVLGPVPLGVYTLDVSTAIAEYTTSPILQARVPRLPGVVAQGREVTSVDPLGAPPRMFALDPGTSARVPVVVGDAPAPPVNVRLQPPPLIRGEIKLELDAAHPFEPDVTRYITLDEATGRPRFVRILPQRSEPHEFAYAVLPAAYWLRSSSATLVIKSVTCDGRDCTHQPVDVSDGRHAPDIVVTVTNATPRLSGTVQARSGVTTPATVIAFPADPNLWTHYGLVPARFRVAPVGAAGFYQLTRLPAGDYFVVAVPAPRADSWRDPDFLRRASAHALRVSLGWGDVRSQDLVLADFR
jgi:Carboxypeptidase regulatory-like domain